MKSILLASASIVAFAGAASAQDDMPLGIIFGGEASFGFQDSFDDDDPADVDQFETETGFFYEADLSVTFRTRMNNGLIGQSTFTIPIADTNIGDELGVDNDFVLGLSIDGMGGVFLGDVAFGAEEFDFATMQSADFSEQDGETTLRGEATFADFTIVGSGIVADEENDEPRLGNDNNDRDYLDQLSIGANGSIGRFALSFGYQEESRAFRTTAAEGAGDGIALDDPATLDFDESAESISNRYDTDNGDFNTDEQFGIAVGTTFGGFTVTGGYGQNTTADTESYGIKVEVPVGPLAVSAEYVFEPDFDNDSYSIGASYDSGRIVVDAEFGEEVGEEEYDLKVGFRLSEVTSIQAGYNDDDKGFVAARQNIGDNAFVELSYADSEDAGFDNDEFVGDIRDGITVKVGLQF